MIGTGSFPEVKRPG